MKKLSFLCVTGTRSIILACSFLIFAVTSLKAQPVSTTELYKAPFTNVAPTIDGIASDACWANASWVSINNLYLGAAYTPADFTGRYKMVWTASKLYLLAEITDDILSDDHPDPLKNYWDDDCVEIFLDEDKSGGNHQTNYNAFAYHVSLSYDPVDGDTESHVLSNDVFTRKVTTGTVTIWEFAINIYPDTYVFGANNVPVTLFEGKKLGFNLAYCDNDAGITRESFIGSRFLQGADKDRGYITADVFATLELVEGIATGVSSAEEKAIKLYPNPTPGSFAISTDLTVDHITVTNSAGVEVFNRAYKSTSKPIEIDLLNQPKGAYIIQVKSGEKVLNKKIILE